MIGAMELLIILFLIFVVLIIIIRIIKNTPAGSSRESGDSSKNQVPKRFRRGIRGTVRDLQKDLHYLSLLLERQDESGNVVEHLPIEINLGKSGYIKGLIINNGDTLVVIGRRNRKGLMIPRRIFNVTTKLDIQIKKIGFFATVLFFPLGILFLASWPSLIYGVIMMTSSNADKVGERLLLVLGSLFCLFIFYWIYIRGGRMGN